VTDAVPHGPSAKPAGAAANAPAEARSRNPRYCCVPAMRSVYVVCGVYGFGSAIDHAVDRGAAEHMLVVERNDGAITLHATDGAPFEYAAISGNNHNNDNNSNNSHSFIVFVCEFFFF